MNMEKLLISACLLGVNCKYSGGNNRLDDTVLDRLLAGYDLIPVCPESDGGLSTPRDPSERVGDKVMSCYGKDVTAEFDSGAHIALEKALSNGCKMALMKELSPSCGSGKIYDGTFTGKVIDGYGVTAGLLIENGIEVFGEGSADMLFQS